MNAPRALANLQRNAALPTFDVGRLIDLYLAARLAAYLKNIEAANRPSETVTAPEASNA
jgi:hypothetical protein